MEKESSSERQILLDKIAKSEISRILKELSIPDSHKDNIFEKYKKIHSSINPDKIYHDPETLVPLIIYFYCKVHKIPINSLDIIEHSRLTERVFRIFVSGILTFDFNDSSSSKTDTGLSVQNFKRLMEKNNNSQDLQKKGDNS